MSTNDNGPIDRALGWILAIGLVAGKALKWLLLWPYELVTTYLAIGEKRREAAEGANEDEDEGEVGDAGGEGSGGETH